jgi:hypothetical protein
MPQAMLRANTKVQKAISQRSRDGGKKAGRTMKASLKPRPDARKSDLTRAI